RQFKTFSYQQSRFVNNVVLKELRHGNIKPLLALLASSWAGGKLYNSVRALLRDETPRQQTEDQKQVDTISRITKNPRVARWLSDTINEIAAIGSLGLYSEIGQTARELGRMEAPRLTEPVGLSSAQNLIRFFNVLSDDQGQKAQRIS